MRYIKKLIHGLRSPALKDEVGVYVSDGIVSPSFRKEVRLIKSVFEMCYSDYRGPP